MIWNQVQDLKGLKVYDVKKTVVASHLSYRDLWAVIASHVLCCLSFPRATSAISLSSLEQIREQSGSLSPTIQQHWQGDVLQSFDIESIHGTQNPWISSPKNLLRCPKSETRFQALLPITLRPRAVVVLGVHCGAFGEQKLRSRDVAVDCRQVQRRVASGGFPGAVGREAEAAETTKVEQSWAPSRSTDKRTNVSGLNIFKSVQNKKQSQTHSTSFNTSCFRQITFNETMSINIVYFILLVDTLGCFT